MKSENGKLKGMVSATLYLLWAASSHSPKVSMSHSQKKEADGIMGQWENDIFLSRVADTIPFSFPFSLFT